MQRWAFAQAVATAAVLAVALAGCTGSDEGSGAVESQSGGADASLPVPSGKYSSLPEPCTALSTGKLGELLPGTVDEESDEDAEEALTGRPDLTYDADRQVGCRWERETTEGGHKLELQFERIVSYDDEISDDQQAAQIYAERAEEHDVDVSSDRPDLPDKTDTGNGTGESSPQNAGGTDGSEKGGKSSGRPAKGGTDENTGADGGPDGGTDSGSDSPDDGSSPSETIAPRPLDDIGDESFLDDRTGGAGAGVQREVTVVFRTSNVVVTVTYDQWHTAGSEPPDSAELQQRAQQVADQLADQLTD